MSALGPRGGLGVGGGGGLGRFPWLLGTGKCGRAREGALLERYTAPSSSAWARGPCAASLRTTPPSRSLRPGSVLRKGSREGANPSRRAAAETRSGRASSPHLTSPWARLFRKKKAPGLERVGRRSPGLRLKDPRGCPERGAGGQGSGCGGAGCKGGLRGPQRAAGQGSGLARAGGPSCAPPPRRSEPPREAGLPPAPPPRSPSLPSLAFLSPAISLSAWPSPVGVSESLSIWGVGRPHCFAAFLSSPDWRPLLAVSPALAPSPDLCFGLCPSRSPPHPKPAPASPPPPSLRLSLSRQLSVPLLVPAPPELLSQPLCVPVPPGLFQLPRRAPGLSHPSPPAK